MRGAFIVIDGVGGSGKTTQVKLLRESLGEKFLFTHEPGGAPRAEQIRKLLLEGYSEKPSPMMDFFLFWAARVEHVRERIVPALEKGTHVISDRFDSATFAFQIHGEEQSELDSVFWEARNVVLKDAMPDHYILLDIVPEEAAKWRGARGPTKDRFDERDVAFQTRVRAGYKAFADKLGTKATIVDANRAMEEVHNDIVGIVRRFAR